MYSNYHEKIRQSMDKGAKIIKDMIPSNKKESHSEYDRTTLNTADTTVPEQKFVDCLKKIKAT